MRGHRASAPLLQASRAPTASAKLDIFMAGRQSSAVDKALKLIAKGSTPYAAAKKVGIALSTIYRAIKRQKPS